MNAPESLVTADRPESWGIGYIALVRNGLPLFAEVSMSGVKILEHVSDPPRVISVALEPAPFDDEVLSLVFAVLLTPNGKVYTAEIVDRAIGLRRVPLPRVGGREAFVFSLCTGAALAVGDGRAPRGSKFSPAMWGRNWKQRSRRV